MSEVHLQLIAAEFRDRTGASRALAAVLRARAWVPRGILDAAAVTRAEDGALLLQGAAEAVPGGFAMSPITGMVLGLLSGAAAFDTLHHPFGTPVGWARTTRALKGQLRDLAALLTPATSVLITIVAPSGAAEVAGVVLDLAEKLAVEDLPEGTIAAMAHEPALFFSSETGAAMPRGVLASPHPSFVALVDTWEAPQPLG